MYLGVGELVISVMGVIFLSHFIHPYLPFILMGVMSILVIVGIIHFHITHELEYDFSRRAKLSRQWKVERGIINCFCKHIPMYYIFYSRKRRYKKMFTRVTNKETDIQLTIVTLYYISSVMDDLGNKKVEKRHTNVFLEDNN